MDITSPVYLTMRKRVIRKLMECVQEYSNVIGFQLDNETSITTRRDPMYRSVLCGTCGEKFGTVEELNREFGFNYWSNRVDSWKCSGCDGQHQRQLPGRFEKFRRELVTGILRGSRSWFRNT